MSKYGYLEVFHSPLEFEITRVDCIHNICAGAHQFLQFTCVSSKDTDQPVDVQTDQCLRWRMQKHWVLVGIHRAHCNETERMAS